MVRSRISLTLGCAAAVWLAAPLRAQVVEEARLTAENPITSDVLGYATAFDGTTIVGGAPFGANSGRLQVGQTFIFRRDSEGMWAQHDLLVPPQLVANMWFGIKVAIDGDTAAVGAPGETRGGLFRVGAAYVYDFDPNSGQWNLTQRLVQDPFVPVDLFGGSVAVSGETLFVGANGWDVNGLSTGSLFVYEKVAGQWNQTDMLVPETRGRADNFGFNSAIHGDIGVVGAHRADVNGLHDAGAAYAVVKTGGTWGLQQLTPSVFQAEARFGEAVQVRGERIAVGAPREDWGGAEQPGAAYVFELIENEWMQTARLTAPGGQAFDRFGQSVVIDGDAVLVGAFLQSGGGAAHLFHKIDGDWQYITQILPSDPGDLTFGWTLGMRGDIAAIAAPFYELNQGALYVFSGLSPCDPCGMDCDGIVNAFDIEPFLDLLFDPNATRCNSCTGDANGDGAIDAFDIEPFLACLFP